MPRMISNSDVKLCLSVPLWAAGRKALVRPLYIDELRAGFMNNCGSHSGFDVHLLHHRHTLGAKIHLLAGGSDVRRPFDETNIGSDTRQSVCKGWACNPATNNEDFQGGHGHSTLSFNENMDYNDKYISLESDRKV
jgi:hypothetical protein